MEGWDSGRERVRERRREMGERVGVGKFRRKRWRIRLGKNNGMKERRKG